jgi:Zn-dependent protease with chaperone function
MQIPVSTEFKKNARSAVYAIAFFILVYLLLFAAAVGIAVACFFGAFALLGVTLSIYMILIALGIAGIGLIILFFMIKFLFATYKVDRSNMLQITREQEPELFRIIDELVQQTETQPPKKVYLSAELNAAVFYDSSFWSLFLPVSKNLIIGLPLINTSTVDELRGVLAHEFGHFSQKSMKVGSYVYQVNRVLHNLLFDNDKFGNALAKWASIDGIIAIFTRISIWFIQGIQKVLQSMYGLVNTKYSALSLQMEFHADAVAAHCTGSKPLQNFLMRIDLVDAAWQKTIQHHIAHKTHPNNMGEILLQQRFVCEELAKEEKIPTHNGLPMVNLNHLQQFNKSKLVIKDQWASHPPMEDRILALQQLNINQSSEDSRAALTLLKHTENYIQHFSKIIAFQYYGETMANPDSEHVSLEQFKAEYSSKNAETQQPEIFNRYFIYRNPIPQIEDNLNVLQSPWSDEELNNNRQKQIEGLFSNEWIEKAIQCYYLKEDIETIQQIINAPNAIRTFDYDGVKYQKVDAASLLEKLKQEEKDLEEDLKNHDQKINSIFWHHANAEQKREIEQRSKLIQEKLEGTAKENEFIQQFNESTSFFQLSLPYEEISIRLAEVKGREGVLKDKLKALKTELSGTSILDQEMTTFLNNFLGRDYAYFSGTSYFDSEIVELMEAFNLYIHLYNSSIYYHKIKLLRTLEHIYHQS